MNRITFRSLMVVPALLVLLCVPSVASADGITWSLSGVTFDDGGTASGSFVYDAVTNTVSSINIVTTAGTTFSGSTYTALSPGFSPPLPFDFVFVPSASGDLTGTMYLDLELPMPGLTNSGGFVSLMDIGSEGLCADAECDTPADSPIRMITGGELVSPVVATPEPSAFVLLGMGLVCLLGAAKVKVLQA
jgi:hypothetical protein